MYLKKISLVDHVFFSLFRLKGVWVGQPKSKYSSDLENSTGKLEAKY